MASKILGQTTTWLHTLTYQAEKGYQSWKQGIKRQLEKHC